MTHWKKRLGGVKENEPEKAPFFRLIFSGEQHRQLWNTHCLSSHCALAVPEKTAAFNSMPLAFDWLCILICMSHIYQATGLSNMHYCSIINVMPCTLLSISINALHLSWLQLDMLCSHHSTEAFMYTWHCRQALPPSCLTCCVLRSSTALFCWRQIAA